MADADSTCVHCGGTVPPVITKLGKVSKTVRKYCSQKCKSHGKRESQKASGTYRSGWDKSPRPTVKRHCLQCGIEFDSIQSTGAQGGWTRHCSMACGRRSRSRKSTVVTKEKQSLLRIKGNVSRRDPVRVRVAMEIAKLKRIGLRFIRMLPSQGGPKVIRKPCSGCGAEFASLRSLAKTLCAGCATKRFKAQRKKDKRIYKAKRRAVTRGRDADQIDPIKVFERDKWRCKICGVKAPKGKRGLEVDDAPQLDHITSLADGGDHTWANVQCLCRKCNLNKGAKSFGQLHLIAA